MDPQEPVLTALLFLIMIVDIGEEVKRSIVRSFVNDTRNSLKIKEDRKALQKDLDIIYIWMGKWKSDEI